MMYKLVNSLLDPSKTVSVNKIEDSGAIRCIPFDPANRSYQEYLAWLAEGNEPLPADTPAAE